MGKSTRKFNSLKLTWIFNLNGQRKIYRIYKGKYRCKKCRKYVKISKMICNNPSKYRIFYNYQKKEPMTEQLITGYKE